MRFILRFFLVVFMLGAALGSLVAGWGYFYVTRDLPKLTRVEDYNPPAATRVLSKNGTLIAEFYTEESRRYIVKLSQIPLHVRQAFLAAEDASFYKHSGVDPVSIMRAVYKNFMGGDKKQGASTITQQVVKNLLLTPEKKFTRKIKEALLAFQLERKLSKDDILEIYLNQIFFGNRAHGISAAAKLYFRKDVSELTIAEAALLAGLPKAPSRFSPLSNPKRARERQLYVLGQMQRAQFITEDQSRVAQEEKIKVYPAQSITIFHAPSFVTDIRQTMLSAHPELDLDTDGLTIETTLDLEAEAMAERDLRAGLRDVDKRRGWRGPVASGLSKDDFTAKYPAPSLETLQNAEPFPALVTEVVKGQAKLFFADQEFSLNLAEATWAKKRLAKDGSYTFIDPAISTKPGDVLEILAKQDKDDSKKFQISLSQTPELEGSLVLLDPFTGEVAAMVGGYDYGRSQFNRATQSYRQPGSTFKPILYLTAVDGFQYTPSTIVYDVARSFRAGDQVWMPENFDETFMGPITLRTALEKSRNLVSADIVSRIGVEAVINYARRLGIESRLGLNLSLALGSSEVTLLELARAYGVFAAQGTLVDSTLIRRIVDRHGKELYNSATDLAARSKKVVSPESAFVMTNMLKGVIQNGTGTKVKELGRPAAGKTGTSNDEMDAWFVGFTPRWVSGIWVGFDQKKKIGEKETGGRVSAPIFTDFMRDFLTLREPLPDPKAAAVKAIAAKNAGTSTDSTTESAPTTPEEQAEQVPEPILSLDFPIPNTMQPFWINKTTGVRAAEGSEGAFLEYFAPGTEPNEGQVEASESATSYLEMPGL